MYHLKPQEHLAHAIRRMARAEADDAVEQLGRAKGRARVEAVHEARKSVKKIRALLRLARTELGETTYGEERDAYRAIGRSLSTVRDADVLVETIDELEDELGTPGLKATASALRERLVQHRRAVLKQLLDGQHVVDTAIEAFKVARERIEQWPLHDDHWPTVRRGFEETYLRGRQACADAYTDRAPELFHEWRKRVKDLTYHLRVLSPLWPEIIERWSEAADALGDRLGKHHDLVVIQAALPQHLTGVVRADAIRKFSDAIDRRKHALEEDSTQPGRLLYAEPRKIIAKRLTEYWQVWRSADADGTGTGTG
jgi:CHAD domain-containing protein